MQCIHDKVMTINVVSRQSDEERARTPGFARVQQGSSWISGTGFDADNVTQVFNFHSNVTGSYKR